VGASTVTESHSPQNFSRNWGQYAVKAVFTEEKAAENGVPWPKLDAEAIESHKRDLAPKIEGQLYALPTPILVNTREVVDVLKFKQDGKLIRVYPPFPLDEKGETSGALSEILIPEGIDKIEARVPMPSSAAKGLRVALGMGDGLEWCRGLRADVESGANPYPIIDSLIKHITQATHQWWLRAIHNPMLGMKRTGAQLTRSFKFASELRVEGAVQIESSWYGAGEYQPNLGFGAALTKGTWILSCAHVQDGRKVDQALLAFYDGMAAYMAEEDDKAILSLCISVEIMLAKHSLIVLGRAPVKLEKAVRTTRLIDENVRTILAQLVRDRNHVAHGRDIDSTTASGRYSLEDCLQAVSALVGAYLRSLPKGSWTRVMSLRIPGDHILRAAGKPPTS
jgi:hypothetical protein